MRSAPGAVEILSFEAKRAQLERSKSAKNRAGHMFLRYFVFAGKRCEKIGAKRADILRTFERRRYDQGKSREPTIKILTELLWRHMFEPTHVRRAKNSHVHPENFGAARPARFLRVPADHFVLVTSLILVACHATTCHRPFRLKKVPVFL